MSGGHSEGAAPNQAADRRAFGDRSSPCGGDAGSLSGHRIGSAVFGPVGAHAESRKPVAQRGQRSLRDAEGGRSLRDAEGGRTLASGHARATCPR